MQCPKCKSKDLTDHKQTFSLLGGYRWFCHDCKNTWGILSSKTIVKGAHMAPEELIPIRIDRYFNNNEETIYADWNFPRLFEKGIKGYPLGRGKTEEGAIRDLIYRTNMESKTSFRYDQVEVTRRD